MRFILPFISAIVSVGATTPPPKTFTTNFDKITAEPLGELPRVPIPTDQLAFNNLRVRSNRLNLLRANSAPNLAGSSNLNRLLTGAPGPNITVHYRGSPVKYYRLFSTFIGCAITSTASVPVNGGTSPLPAVQVPQSCSLLFTATKLGGGTASKTCSYNALRVPPTTEKCEFPSTFSDVVITKIEVLNAATLNETTVLTVDDVVHENHYY